MNKLLRTDRFRTYSISQLCREFGCTTRALRFYEEQGLLFPRRDGQQRVYSYKDRARLKLVVGGRAVGLSIAEIRHLLETYEDRGEAAQNVLAISIFDQRLRALEAEKAQLETAAQLLTAAIERLGGKPAFTAAA
jgi:DNA-binding transcriptional MerR regulator